MLRRVALVRTDVSEELSASIVRVTRIGELGTTLAVTINRSTVRRTTRRNIPEDATLHSHRRENLKSYISHLCFADHTGTIYATWDLENSIFEERVNHFIILLKKWLEHRETFLLYVQVSALTEHST
jgi:hypothetical protein